MTRRKFTSKFKTKVALEAIKEQESLAALAEKFDLHGTGHPAQSNFPMEAGFSL